MKRRLHNYSGMLSVIVPAYRQEKTIKRDIKQIENSLKKLGRKFEVIVVVDGLVDNTYKEVKSIASPCIKIFSYLNNKGKGHAVRYGMLKAKGNIVGFMDAGMDINPNGLSMLLNHMEWYNADIIVGSKLHPVSKVVYPFERRVLSWGYRLLTRLLFGFQVKDTQVGLKFFRRRVIRDVLPRLVVKTYAFDIELLAVSYKLGYRRIYEAPVEIRFKGNIIGSITSKDLWKVILLMLYDTLAVFYRLRVLRYYDKHKRETKILSRVNFKTNLLNLL